jgi:hypothetical protein
MIYTINKQEAELGPWAEDPPQPVVPWRQSGPVRRVVFILAEAVTVAVVDAATKEAEMEQRPVGVLRPGSESGWWGGGGGCVPPTSESMIGRGVCVSISPSLSPMDVSCVLPDVSCPAVNPVRPSAVVMSLLITVAAESTEKTVEEVAALEAKLPGSQWIPAVAMKTLVRQTAAVSMVRRAVAISERAVRCGRTL